MNIDDLPEKYREGGWLVDLKRTKHGIFWGVEINLPRHGVVYRLNTSYRDHMIAASVAESLDNGAASAPSGEGLVRVPNMYR